MISTGKCNHTDRPVCGGRVPWRAWLQDPAGTDTALSCRMTALPCAVHDTALLSWEGDINSADMCCSGAHRGNL